MWVCLPVCRERVYHPDVSAVLVRYSKMLRALHRTFARPMKMSNSSRIQLPSMSGPEDDDDKKIIYMSLWGWIDMLTSIEFFDEVR